MELLTQEQRARLLENGKRNAERLADPYNKSGKTDDHRPVVKLFTPDGAATWLLAELDPQDPDIAFGLCDLGFGCPELGSVRLSELQAVRGPLGLSVERDLHFCAEKTLSAYADDARQTGCIRT
jgi:hypothetical protein